MSGLNYGLLKSLEILKQFGYGALAFTDSNELANKIPFYKDILLPNQNRPGKQGIFFQHDGLISSNKLRAFLWNYLKSKSNIRFYLNSEISHLIINDHSEVVGVALQNSEEIATNITVLATGLGTKKILARHQFELPLWSVWGAAAKAQLLDTSTPVPTGGVSFHRQRCITAIPDGKTVIVAGTSMVVPNNEIPHSSLYQGKLSKGLQEIFGDKIDYSTVKYNLAPRTGVPDDLPIFSWNDPNMKNLIVLVPTSHLGNTQSIALGQLAAIGILRRQGLEIPFPEGLDLNEYRLNRFQEDLQMVRENRRLGKSLLSDDIRGGQHTAARSRL